MRNLMLKIFIYLSFIILGIILVAYSRILYYFIIGCLGWWSVFRFVEWLVDGE